MYPECTLFDNGFAGASGGVTVCYDRFVSLDTAHWGLCGSPAPHLLAGFGSPELSLMTSGDWQNDSGLYSHDVCDWRAGFQIQADVYVGSTTDCHSIEFGVAGRNVPEAEQFGHGALFRRSRPSS
jgi:hypothetical protein